MSDLLSDGGRADALNRLNGPSIALIALGALEALYSLVGIASALVRLVTGSTPQGFPDLGEFGQQFSGEEQQQILDVSKALGGTLGIFASFMTLFAAVVILAGGVKMRSGEMYGLSVAAAVVACLPCVTPCCCCCLGMPVGIWALIVLLDPHVKDAFR